MKVSAVHLKTEFADVVANLTQAEIIVKEAVQNGAEMVIFPEFFTTGFNFSEKMMQAVATSPNIEDYIKRWSKEYQIIIGGSYINYDGSDAHNTFCLVFPNGQTFLHNKDIPTIIENCYYAPGDPQNVLETPIGGIGVAMCWEMMRYDTVRRMQGKVNLIIGGSCWWDIMDGDFPGDVEKLRSFSAEEALISPVRMAKMLGVPFIHASHEAVFEGKHLKDQSLMRSRTIMGATQIVDGDGNVLIRRQHGEGAGILYADIQIDKLSLANLNTTDYWISLPDSFTPNWKLLNSKFESYYQQVSLPYYMKNSSH